jgi:hypothetical protein
MYHGRVVAPDRVLAQFKPKPGHAELARLAAAMQATWRWVGGCGAVLFQSRDQDVSQLSAYLREQPGLVYVEPDGVEIPQSVTPNDPDFPLQWDLTNDGQCVPPDPLLGGPETCGTPGVDIAAETAWNYSVGPGTGGAEPVIVVLDSGLSGSDMAGNVWTAPSAFTLNLGAGPFTCPQGTAGLSVVTNDSGCGSPGEPDVSSDYHGTKMAEIIGAAGNDGAATAGVLWHTLVFPIRIFNSAGVIYDSDDAAGIEAAVQLKQRFGAQMNIVALNMSYANFAYDGTNGYSQTEENELARAQQYGILAVVAAGNNGAVGPDYPAAFYLPNEIVVGASDQNDNVSEWGSLGASNAGADIDAPGTNVYTGYGAYQTVSMDGTSPATAVVSGTVGLIDAACKVPWKPLENLLYGTAAHPSGIPASFAAYGRVDLGAAVQECATGVPGVGAMTFSGQATAVAAGPAVTCRTCCPPNCGGPTPTPAYGTITVSMYNWSWSFPFNACCDSAAQLASAAAAAITADPSAPVRSSASGSTATLTTVAGGPYTDYPFNVGIHDECVSSSTIQ